MKVKSGAITCRGLENQIHASHEKKPGCLGWFRGLVILAFVNRVKFYPITGIPRKPTRIQWNSYPKAFFFVAHVFLNLQGVF